jgi:quercetin dioxygenase-like cupin family protein
MRATLLLLAALLLPSLPAADVAMLMTKDIPEFKGKEVTMSTVTYAPGQSSAPHRHNAHVFVYVLSGKVVMQVTGGDEKHLGPGETFYETPSDIHSVSRNASATEPAKLLVVMLKEKGRPATTPSPAK